MGRTAGLEVIRWEKEPQPTSALFEEDPGANTVIRPIHTFIPEKLQKPFRRTGLASFLEQTRTITTECIDYVQQRLPNVGVIEYDWLLLDLVHPPEDLSKDTSELHSVFKLASNMMLGARTEHVSGVPYMDFGNLSPENYEFTTSLVRLLREARLQTAKQQGWYLLDICDPSQFLISGNSADIEENLVTLVDIEPWIETKAFLLDGHAQGHDTDIDYELALFHNVTPIED